MNIVGAHDTARNAADRFGKPFRVWRMPLWPAGEYGATSIDLPGNAEIIATYPDAAVPSPKPVSAAPDVAQGSLF